MKTDSLFSGNYLFFFLLVFSAAFFVYQHSTGLSWDFSTYVLNAKYLFSNGIYFEWGRPPLAPILIGIFSIFGWLAAEYLYIIFVSLLFAYSSAMFAKRIGADRTLFYGLMLTPFVLNFGFSIGTELLQLALLQLSLAYLHSRRLGIFLSMLSLAHYSKIVYAILAFFQKDARKILLAFGIVLAAFTPWLVFNYLLKGDPLTSIADQYALTVKFRDYMQMPVNIIDMLSVGGYYLLLLPVGIYAARKKLLREQNLIILAVLALSLFSYAFIPHKEARYLFTLTLPLAYFSWIAVKRMKRWREAGLLIAAVNMVLAAATFVPLENAGHFNIVKDVDGCMLSSNAWVYLDYFGRNTDPYPRKQFVPGEIENGKRIILFKGVPEPDYLSDKEFMDSLPKIAENRDYVILGNVSRCAAVKKVDVTYLEQLRREGVNVSNCEVLFPQAICGLWGSKT